MEARISGVLESVSWVSSENLVRKPAGFMHFAQKCRPRQWPRVVISCDFQPRNCSRRSDSFVISCSQNVPASILEPGSFPASSDDVTVLKNKSEGIQPYINGKNIYLVGMMGSGKTTVGRILSDALGYSFFDCDTLIEEAAGGTTVAEIFKLYGENYFRENETEVLRKLSSMQRLVISTGGGAVVRPINWNYMGKGISVWLDVPLKALAKRIVAVGTESRPLLHHESGDAYTKTLKRLSLLWEERGESYANSSARVSLTNIVAKLGCRDVSEVSPTAIAIEALVQIENYLKKRGA